MKFEDIDLTLYDNMPITALILDISKNRIKYARNIDPEFKIMPHGRYLIEILNTENITQEDLAKKYGVTKGNIAKSLKKLEYEGYITREIDENNRRRHIIKITEKGNDFIYKSIKIHNEWDNLVGITELDKDTREKIKQIAIKSKKLIME